MGKFSELSCEELFVTEGGRIDPWGAVKSHLGSYIVSSIISATIVGKTINSIVNSVVNSVWSAIKAGPSKNDPMFNTSYYRIFGNCR